MTKRRFGPYTVETSSEDKLLFPDAGLTKGDMIAYYEAVAPLMLPHLENRPVTLHRFPEGIGKDGFFQQNMPYYFPDWFARVTLPKEDGEVEHMVCNNAASLVYLANQGTITPHVWLSRRDKPETPDRMIYDLDPPGEGDNALVKAAALAIRRALDDVGLPSYVKSTGSRGLHVMVPLRRDWEFDDVRAFARDLAKLTAAREPKKFTIEQRKDKRQGRLFLDTLRNSYGQTAVAPYALRAKPGAPVALPMTWDELEGGAFDPRAHKLPEVLKKAKTGLEDPWKGMARRAHGLGSARKTLERLLAEEAEGGD